MDYAALLKTAITQKDAATARDAKLATNPMYKGVDMATNTAAAITPPVTPPTGDVNVPTNTPSPYQAPQAVDNSGMINTQYGDLITALKAQIQQSVNNKNQTIGGLGAKYQPDKNASEVAKYGQVQSLNEQAANAGDRGGIGRQNTLQAMIGGENRLNSINLQQTSEKTALENDIANLMLEGNIQEAQLQAQKLKDLIANSTNMDNTNYQRAQDTANQTGYLSNGQETLAKQQIDTSNEQWDKTYAMNKEAADLNNALTRINIDTANINLAALPKQIQDQAILVTQQIAKGELDLETGRAQLKELTDPNSITNQMNQLGLDTAKFNYSQLSVQAQQQAAQVANDLANGAMSRAQAQAAINKASESSAQEDPNANKTSDFAAVINAQFMQGGKLDSAGVKSYLDGLINAGVDDSIIDALAERYGITNSTAQAPTLPTTSIDPNLFRNTARNALK